MGCTLSGLMGLEDTVAIPTFVGAGVCESLSSHSKWPKTTQRKAYRDLEVRARNAIPQAGQLQWVKAHQTRQAVDDGRITIEDFQGNQEADVVANVGAAEHDAHEPCGPGCWTLVASPGLVPGCRRRSRCCRWSRSPRRLVRLVLTKESLNTTSLPVAWTVTGKREWYEAGLILHTSQEPGGPSPEKKLPAAAKRRCGVLRSAP
eukprot:26743-Amphidinium_carterae.1